YVHHAELVAAANGQAIDHIVADEHRFHRLQTVAAAWASVGPAKERDCRCVTIGDGRGRLTGSALDPSLDVIWHGSMDAAAGRALGRFIGRRPALVPDPGHAAVGPVLG